MTKIILIALSVVTFSSSRPLHADSKDGPDRSSHGGEEADLETALHDSGNGHIADGSFHLDARDSVDWAYFITPANPVFRASGDYQYLKTIQFASDHGETKSLDFESVPDVHVTKYNVSGNARFIILHEYQNQLPPNRPSRRWLETQRIVDFRGQEVPVPAALPTLFDLSSEGKLGFGPAGLVRLSDGRRLGHAGEKAFFPEQESGVALFNVGTLSLYDEDASFLWTQDVPGPNVLNVAFSPNQHYIAVVSGSLANMELNVFDQGGKRLWREKILPGPAGLQFSTDEKLLFSVTRKENVIYEAPTGRPVVRVAHEDVFDTASLEIAWPTPLISKDDTRFVVLAPTRHIVAPNAKVDPGQGPDLIFWFDANGHVHKALKSPRGRLCRDLRNITEKMIAEVALDGKRVFVLTPAGVRAIPLE